MYIQLESSVFVALGDQMGYSSSIDNRMNFCCLATNMNSTTNLNCLLFNRTEQNLF